MSGHHINQAVWRRWAAYISAIATLGAVAATVSVGSAEASSARRAAAMPTKPPPAVVPAAKLKASQEAIMSYWTPSRMASAKPAQPVVGAASAKGSKADNAGNTATGRPGLAGGYVPGGLHAGPAQGATINTNAQSSSVLPADGGYPGPNDTYNWIGKQGTFPVSSVGKLFFTEPGGNFVCSAAATYGGGNKNMVWTAGHCVGPQGGRSYYSNFLFCPEYNNGANPQIGCWSWALAQQIGGWYFNGYWSADYAYLYMQPTGTVKANHVVAVTGGLGFGWNWSRDQFWQDFGYPSGSPYSGGKLVITSAEHRYDVTNPGSDPGQQDNSIGSSQTPGFSGGPWVLSFGHSSTADPIGHGDWINGNNSYYFTSGGPGGGNEYGTEIQSPYYDTNACNFWKGGSGWPGTC